MTELYEEPNVPLWIGTTPSTSYPTLNADTTVDVAVVGAGIVGITLAALLKQSGKTVALLEAGGIARSVTGHTTAKLTSLHTLKYADLIKQFDKERAQLYADANQTAIQRVAQFIDELDIECDFERMPAITYTRDDAHVQDIEREVEALNSLGLLASLTTDTSLPFAVRAAVRLEDQAQFHPRKYLLPIAETIPGDGSHIFENTTVLDVDEHDSYCSVSTASGEVRARDVVIATHLPILDRGLFFAIAHPHRGYVVAGPIAQGAAPYGMYINVESPTRSVRTALDGDGTRLLLVSGAGHKTGVKKDPESSYLELEEWTRDEFGLSDFRYRWSTQDYTATDDVPFVGKLRDSSQHLYVATAFGSWGMSNGTAAAMLLADMIEGRDNPWLALYDATRKSAFAKRKFVTENSKAAAHWVGDRISAAEGTNIDDVGPGEGKILRLDGQNVAVYRDAENDLHAVSPVCTHMGCLVNFNKSERTWDCPCHGSRFTFDGEVVNGPATTPLAKKSLVRKTPPSPA